MTVFADYLDVGDLDDTGWIGESLVKGVGKAVSGAAKAVGKAASGAARVVGKGIKAAGPVWDIAQTGASFIPGVGTAVSSGMAAAAALGRGKSLKDSALAGARGALPGGAVTRAAFDVAVGAAKGQRLDALALRAARNAVPGGPVGKAVFDAGLAVATKAGAGQIMRARKRLRTKAEREAFDAAVRGANKAKPKARKLPRLRRRNPVRRVSLPLRQPGPSRFGDLTPSANRVAGALLGNRAMRAKNAAGLAKALGVQRRDARSAVAAVAKRYGCQCRDFRDVGDLETVDAVAERNGVRLPDDLQTVPADTLEVIVVPPVPVSQGFLQALFARGDAHIKRALQAHELLATLARETGELEGPTGWRIRSGDYPYKVAQTVTGDANRWREIPAVNPGMKIYTDSQGRTQLSGWTVGKLINLPPSWFPSQLEPPAAAEDEDDESEGRFPPPSQYPNGYPSPVYVVKDGDMGEKIAERITGEKRRWTELVKANPKLADEKYGLRIYAGQTIKLPESWVAAAPSPEAISAEAEAERGDETPEAETPAPILQAEPVTEPEPVTPEPVTPEPVIASEPPAAEPVATPAPSPAPAAEPVEAPPIVSGTPQQIATVQVMLGFFFQKHPEATWAIQGSPYGSEPEDYAGRWTDRTTAALAAFDRWHNRTVGTPTLDEDGLPDPVSIAALRAQSERDAGVAPGSFPTLPAPVPVRASPAPQVVQTTPSPSPAQTPPTAAPAPATRAPTAAAPKKSSDAGPLLLLGAAAALPFLF